MAHPWNIYFMVKKVPGFWLMAISPLTVVEKRKTSRKTMTVPFCSKTCSPLLLILDEMPHFGWWNPPVFLKNLIPFCWQFSMVMSMKPTQNQIFWLKPPFNKRLRKLWSSWYDHMSIKSGGYSIAAIARLSCQLVSPLIVGFTSWIIMSSCFIHPSSSPIFPLNDQTSNHSSPFLFVDKSPFSSPFWLVESHEEFPSLLQIPSSPQEHQVVPLRPETWHALSWPPPQRERWLVDGRHARWNAPEESSNRLPVYIYLYIHTYINTHVHIYIYMYIYIYYIYVMACRYYYAM